MRSLQDNRHKNIQFWPSGRHFRDEEQFLRLTKKLKKVCNVYLLLWLDRHSKIVQKNWNLTLLSGILKGGEILSPPPPVAKW